MICSLIQNLILSNHRLKDLKNSLQIIGAKRKNNLYFSISIIKMENTAKISSLCQKNGLENGLSL
jgi:hypothetical protein